MLLHAVRWIGMRRTELQRKLDVHALTDAGALRARQSVCVPLPQCQADGSFEPMQCTLNNAACCCADAFSAMV